MDMLTGLKQSVDMLTSQQTATLAAVEANRQSQASTLEHEMAAWLLACPATRNTTARMGLGQLGMNPTHKKLIYNIISNILFFNESAACSAAA